MNLLDVRIIPAEQFLALMTHDRFERLSRLCGRINDHLIICLEPPEDAVARHMEKQGGPS